MTRILFALFALLSACASSKPLPPGDAVHVRAYQRSDGVAVREHWRSRPDAWTSNNFGHSPAFNAP